MKIGDRTIQSNQPMYIVAELSANHGNDLEVAKATLRAAAAAGADAVKLQTYTPDTLTIDADTPPFQIGQGTQWEGRNLHQLYDEAAMPWEWHVPLFELGKELGIDVFSTPFDETAIAFLEPFAPVAHKIASFEIVDVNLIQKVAATGRPIVISTGMSREDEIHEALQAARDGGATDICLLRCNSAYPADPAEMHLSTIRDMQERFAVPVGLSDHTMGAEAAVAARVCGAVLLEKHFILDRSVGGPDASFSMEPDEFEEMVAAIRRVEQMMGNVRYGPTEREQASLQFRRSLFVVQDIEKGEQFTSNNVRSIRPANGLHPRHLQEVLGKTSTQAIPRGTPLEWPLVQV